MPVSPTQLESIVRITGTASLITGAASVTDASNYGSIGIVPPDTIKVLLRIYDSTMQLVYQNTGYDAGDFTSPDLQPLAGTPTFNFSLPQNPDGTYRTGNYTVNMKIQCVDDGETVVVQPTKYLNYCNCCNGISFNVNPNVTYNTAIVSLIDNTQYGAYLTLSRTLTLYPPLNVEASQSTSAQTLVWVPTVPIGNPAPYTGVWQWTIESTITYIDQVTSAATTCKITGRGSFEVEQNQLCTVLCLMKNYRAEFYRNAGKKNATPQEINYLLANAEFVQAIQAQACGRPQSQISMYVNKIYQLLGVEDGCECGCEDGNSQPLVPTSSINGADGTDGSTILSGNGVPSNNSGNIGDYYIDVDTQDFYKKTGATTWTLLFNLQGGTGQSFLQDSGVPSNGDGNDGDTYLDNSTGDIYLKVGGSWGSPTLNIIGAAGADGAAVLTNQFPNTATLGTSFETLNASNSGTARTAWSLALNTLTTNGDEIFIHSKFRTTSVSPTTQGCRIQFNGSTLVFSPVFGAVSNCVAIEIDVRLARTSNTTANAVATVRWLANGLLSNPVLYEIRSTVTPIAGLNFTTTAYDITAQADSVVIGDITLDEFEIQLGKI